MDTEPPRSLTLGVPAASADAALIDGHLTGCTGLTALPGRVGRRGSDRWTPGVSVRTLRSYAAASADAALIDGHRGRDHCSGRPGIAASADAALIDGHARVGSRGLANGLPRRPTRL